MRKFNLGMCIAWVVIAILYGILAIMKVEVPAWSVIWPCVFIACEYFSRHLDDMKK